MQKCQRSIELEDSCRDNDDEDYITSIEEVNVVEGKITAALGFAVKRGENDEVKICAYRERLLRYSSKRNDHGMVHLRPKSKCWCNRAISHYKALLRSPLSEVPKRIQ